jgi:hypothetical protein
VRTEFARAELPSTLALERLAAKPRFRLRASQSATGWRFPYNGPLSALVINRLLKAGAKVSVTRPDPAGVSYALAAARPDVWTKATDGFDVVAAAAPAAKLPPATPLNAPRVAIYQSYEPSMDEGWTRFVLDQYGFDYTKLHNPDLKAGKLRDRFDVLLLPDQRPQSIVEGLDFKTILPELRGGIGEQGLDNLRRFVAEGGTVVALGQATDLLIDKFPLGIRNVKKTATRDVHFAPGTVVNLQVDTAHPIGYGLPAGTWAYYINSPFFQLTESFSSQKVTVVARYPNTGVNASGWLRGEDLMYGRAAVVTVEMNPGRLVLFGIRPQHRAQTHATLPLLFNALYWPVQGDAM